MLLSVFLEDLLKRINEHGIFSIETYNYVKAVYGDFKFDLKCQSKRIFSSANIICAFTFHGHITDPPRIARIELRILENRFEMLDIPDQGIIYVFYLESKLVNGVPVETRHKIDPAEFLDKLGIIKQFLKTRRSKLEI